MDQEDNKRSWYKNPYIIVVAMVVLVIILALGVILLYWYLYINKNGDDSSNGTSSSSIQESSSSKSSSSMTSSSSSVSSSSSSESSTNAVEQTVVEFYQQLVDGDYESALELLTLSDEDWEFMAAFSETSDISTDAGKAAILEDYCNVVGTCLEAQVISVDMKSEDFYEVTVMFLLPNGSVYELQLEGQDAVSTFTLEVQKIGGEYKVIDYHVYHP